MHMQGGSAVLHAAERYRRIYEIFKKGFVFLLFGDGNAVRSAGGFGGGRYGC